MSAPGGILALDVATSVGWAYGLPGQARPMCGVWTLPGPGDLGRCYAALGNELADALLLHGPGLVVLEAPLVRQDHSARKLLGLAAHVESTCYRWDVECREQSVATVRKGVLGRGNFPKGEAKAAVLAWCRGQGWDPPGHDAADAAVLWKYAVENMQTPRMRRLMARAA